MDDLVDTGNDGALHIELPARAKDSLTLHAPKAATEYAELEQRDERCQENQQAGGKKAHWASWCAEREVRTPSATAFMLSMMSFSFSPFPSRMPTVRLRLRSPTHAMATRQPSKSTALHL